MLLFPSSHGLSGDTSLDVPSWYWILWETYTRLGPGECNKYLLGRSYLALGVSKPRHKNYHHTSFEPAGNSLHSRRIMVKSLLCKCFSEPITFFHHRSHVLIAWVGQLFPNRQLLNGLNQSAAIQPWSTSALHFRLFGNQFSLSLRVVNSG